MASAYCFGPFELRPASRELLVHGQPAGLGTRALDVLTALVERRDRVVAKEELLDLAWPGLVVEENNLQVQISALRKILGDGLIRTVAGRGYQFTAETTCQGVQAPVRPADRCHGLPQALTRFIGHDADLAEYERILDGCRLVTLTGVGGVGKTRLAVELANRVAGKFPHGVWFVDLAPMADESRVPLTVATALELTERSDQPIVATLSEHVKELDMLLVLDNCEHLLDACAALVAALLGHAARVRVLATSREGLGVPGEQILSTRSLLYPGPQSGNAAANLETFEAVRLFVDRARLAQPSFQLDQVTAPAVGEICRRLDGIPLAIELAAARTRVLSIEDLRKRLDDRFRLLVGSSKGGLPRHQTLRATIKWSFDLLTPEERRLLQRLSVFSGGWTLEGAVAIGGDVPEYEVLDQLTRLLDKSLIATQTQGPDTRYTMLETVRQYAAEALAEAGEAEITARRHLEHFVQLAERVAPAFYGNEQRQALERLGAELENIVQALNRCDEPSIPPDLGLRLAAVLSQYWPSLGLVKLGYRLTTEVLTKLRHAGPSPARAQALFVATRSAYFLGRWDETVSWANECLSLARSIQDDHVAAAALAFLGYVATDKGDWASSRAYAEESLRIAREHRDYENIRRALNVLAGAYESAGNVEAAVPLYEEGMQIARDHGDFHAIAVIGCNLADARIERRELGLARAVLNECIEACLADKYAMAGVLGAVTGFAAVKRDWRYAARMLGAADASTEMLGFKRRPGNSFDSHASSIRRHQSDPEIQAAYDAGRAMTADEALSEARAWLQEQPERRPA